MNKQLKSISIQWIAPMAILILALVIMLANFSKKSSEAANNTVTRNIIAAAESCTHIFYEEIALIENVGVPVAEIISYNFGQNVAYLQKPGDDISYLTSLLEIAKENSGAYMAYLCDGNGNAVNDMGEKVSIADKDFYEKLQGTDGVKYLFTEDDSVSAMNAIVVSVPVQTETRDEIKLLMLYDLNNLSNLIKKVEFHAWEMESLIDADGNVAASYGNNKYWKTGDNLFESLSGSKAEVANKLKTQMKASASAMIPMDSGRMLVCTPLGSGGWMAIFGVSQTYIDRQVHQQWEASKNMIYQLIIVFCVFIFFTVSIGIAGKVYSNKKQEQLESKADTDLLTGLSNKLATERKIKEFIAQNPQSQSMMFILDIDNFKKINDTMGHAFGDEVLRSLGQQIRVIFRASDVVGRAGGDEFIVFLKNVSDVEAIRKEAKKVENFFKDFKAGEYTKYSATASIGVAIFPKEGADFESIYKAADSALYKAKKRGKNQLAFYNDEWLGEQNQ